jgi:hypothetical protein
VEAGGQAGVRLAEQMSLPTSRSTLLRWTKRVALPSTGAPRVVGVDEFAWKKGRRYGTILVDLEAHRILALLPNREVETVAAWFRQHPSVLIVTRDRSQAFAEAIRLGAPQALQIADRFHLHCNATECLEKILTREQDTLRQVVTTLRAQACATLPAPQPHVTVKQQLREPRRTRRHDCYEQVVQLAPVWACPAVRLPENWGCTAIRWPAISTPASFPSERHARHVPRPSSPIWRISSSAGPKGNRMANACSKNCGHAAIGPG